MVMPFGLTNALVVFMDLMNTVFKLYLDQFIMLFSYDIMIYSKTLEEYSYHKRKLLEVLRKNEL